MTQLLGLLSIVWQLWAILTCSAIAIPSTFLPVLTASTSMKALAYCGPRLEEDLLWTAFSSIIYFSSVSLRGRKDHPITEQKTTLACSHRTQLFRLPLMLGGGGPFTITQAEGTTICTLPPHANTGAVGSLSPSGVHQEGSHHRHWDSTSFT